MFLYTYPYWKIFVLLLPNILKSNVQIYPQGYVNTFFIHLPKYLVLLSIRPTTGTQYFKKIVSKFTHNNRWVSFTFTQEVCIFYDYPIFERSNQQIYPSTIDAYLIYIYPSILYYLSLH